MPNKVIEMKPPKPVGRTIINPKTSFIHQHCEELEAMLNENIDHGKTEIILDCKSVSFMDSEGLELLITVHEKLNKVGGKLKLCGLNKVSRDIFLATRLINVLQVYEDIQKAVTDG